MFGLYQVRNSTPSILAQYPLPKNKEEHRGGNASWQLRKPSHCLEYTTPVDLGRRYKWPGWISRGHLPRHGGMEHVCYSSHVKALFIFSLSSSPHLLGYFYTKSLMGSIYKGQRCWIKGWFSLVQWKSMILKCTDIQIYVVNCLNLFDISSARSNRNSNPRYHCS